MKPSELTGAELAAMVAEGMGLEEFDGDYWVEDFDGDFRAFRPLDRADHWWRVVRWVRGQEETLLQNFYLRLSFKIKLPEYPHSFLLGFLLDESPGRGICEAFMDELCGEKD